MTINYERAGWADEAITAFMSITGTDREDALGDLLVDLRHWADLNSMDFDNISNAAGQMYQVEVEEDGGRCRAEARAHD